MKSRLVIGLLAAALLVACSQEEQKRGDVEASSGRPDAQPAAQATAPAPSPASTSANVQAANAMAVQSRICPTQDPRCATAGPLQARSEAEAAWLIQHGYPSEQENAKLHAESLGKLKELAAGGNRPAAVVYAEKLALEGGQFNEGFSLLHEQASSGNLFAYYGLSEVLYKDPTKGSLVDSAAYLKVAYLLGDTRASELLERPNFGVAELLAADKRAAGLLQTFAGGVERSPRPLE